MAKKRLGATYAVFLSQLFYFGATVWNNYRQTVSDINLIWIGSFLLLVSAGTLVYEVMN